MTLTVIENDVSVPFGVDMAMAEIIFNNVTIISGDPSQAPYLANVYIANGIIASIVYISSPPHNVLPHVDRTSINGQPEGVFEDQVGPSVPPKHEHRSSTPKAVRIVEGHGRVLCPGFIDLHAHSDLYLLTHPDHTPKLSQGCTTEVVGQDGISYAPVETDQQMMAIRSQIAGWNGNPTKGELHKLQKEGVKGMFEWKSVKEYLDVLEGNRTATNVAFLVPQGNLRLLACGPYNVPASPSQVEHQSSLLRQSMSEGAIGMSSGLTYTPGMYAPTSELAVLCRILAEEFPGAYYAPHHRSYGHKAMESYQEMLDLCISTQCPVHLTHATLNFSENKGRADELLSRIDTTRSAGGDVTLDTYPYLPGCTTLAALLPSWASAGGPGETLKRLEDEMTREKIRYAMEDVGCDGGHGIPMNWTQIQVGTCLDETIAHFSSRRIFDIAQEEDRPSIAIYFEILQKENLATSCIMHVGNEENVRKIMVHPTHCSGTDAILHGETVHPRGYGTFPRFIGHYARDEGLMSIEEMIPHVTSRPAKRMGIYPHRGLIAQSSAADLVLFDPKTIADMATYDSPREKAVGIDMVCVNGKVAYEAGRVTGVRAGMTLRRRKDGLVR